MYISEKYKEGVIYNAQGVILTKVRCKVSATDENIYNTLKVLSNLIESRTKYFRINTIFKDIQDNAPAASSPSEIEVETEDTIITVPKNEYILNNMVFTDEEIYGEPTGDVYTGENRTYRIIWVDDEGTEHFVPLEGIDQFDAVNPHGAYSYNSETKELIFSAFMPYDTDYILRRYYYNE